MREIKFRAWEKNLKEIIPIRSIEFENKVVNSESAWRGFDEIVIMQYTGLKDKNGKEIYEGDLVEHDGEDNGVLVRYEACQVAFDEDYSMFCFIDDAPNNLAQVYRNLEVIGNIYEHPHLLVKEEMK